MDSMVALQDFTIFMAKIVKGRIKICDYLYGTLKRLCGVMESRLDTCNTQLFNQRPDGLDSKLSLHEMPIEY
jgi:hypothetical protein